MVLLDSLIIGGLRFVLGKIGAAVDAEMNDDAALREELLAAQMRLELGEISEADYREIERALLQAINEVRARARGEAPSPGTFTVAGAEVTVVGEEAGGGPGSGGGSP